MLLLLCSQALLSLVHTLTWKRTRVSRVRITLRTTTDAHIGYAGEAGAASWYAQVGPSIVAVDGADTETVLSGKAGASLPVTEALSVYGEISFATGIDDADNGYGTKVGATWSF